MEENATILMLASNSIIILLNFGIYFGQSQNIEGRWLPCIEISRDLRIPCQCFLQQTNSTAIELNCDRVVFIGGDITSIPYGAPITSISQRWSGRQNLPTRAFSSLGLPLAKVDFSSNSLRRLTERLLYSLHNTLTELRLADNLLGDSLNPIFSTTELHGLNLLRLLDLSGNHIKGIEEGIFKGCENLEELFLDRNSLITIPSESLNGPKGLKKLSLKNNRIEMLNTNAFHAQQNLEIIDLSSNLITMIENGALFGLNRLRDLRLRDNRLTTFNSDIFQGAVNLQKLDLSQNFIEEFPSVALKMFVALKHLNLSSNIIKNLDNTNLVALEKLESLVLSRNNIANIAPGTFLGLRKLKHLDISVNSLRAIEDDAFEGLDSLRSLHLDDNNILLIPASAIGRLPHLNALSLAYNRITAVSSEILQSLTAHIKDLVLSQNVIRELPTSAFKYFKSLENLDLSRNLISLLNSDAYHGIEKSVKKLLLSQNRISSLSGPPLSLEKLTHFDISYNRLSELPADFIQKLPSLKYFNISRNTQMYTVPQTLLHNADNLNVIDLSYIGLQTIPSFFFSKSRSLTHIYLTNNVITEISEGTFVNLHNLTVLDLSYNRITNIRLSAFVNVMNIQQLHLRGNLLNAFKGEYFNTGTSLRILDLSDNQLSYIFPSSFRIHPRLQTINAARNKFNFFPAELIASLQYLELVDLSGNELKAIDELDFARLPRLRVLKLADNEIEYISEMAFHNSTQLQILDLRSNKLERLAERTFEGLARLECLDLENNLFTELPDTIFDRSRLHMLENIKLKSNLFEVPPLKALQRQYFFLTSVDLSHNQLVNIPPDDSIMVNIKELDLSFNPLSSESIKNILNEPKTVRKLNLAGTGIEKLTQLETPFLMHLNISFNNITNLPDAVFERTTLLEELDISNNQLRQIFPNAWSTLKNIQLLNISSNPIKSITQTDFNGLHMLKTLNMHNLPECIRLEKNAFMPLRNLKQLVAYDFPKLGYLDMQGILQHLPYLIRVNIEIKDPAVGSDQLGTILHPRLKLLGVHGSRLHSIASGTLSGLKTPKIIIELKNTSLTSLPPTFFFSIPRSTKIILDITGSQLTSLSSQLLLALDDRRNDINLIGLESNPIVCDCSARALKRWLPGHMKSVRCTKPEHLVNRLLVELTDDDLTCDSRKVLQTSTTQQINNYVKTQRPTVQYTQSTEPEIIWSVAPTTTPKIIKPIISSPVNTPTVISNDDTLIIGIVGGVVAFIMILIIVICIIRLRMSSSTEYRGGPMANGVMPTLSAAGGGGNGSCNCSVVKTPGGSMHALYTVPPQSIYAASTLPHRPVSGMRNVDTMRPVYATLASSHGSPAYLQQGVPPSSYFMMPPQDEKIYR
ncbi:protein artichoke [Chrysoperla carnea]|uniref:protein artichoke n=1 Tax=Chrysoperla carnea TaxID=189513 RepID=UPI001D05EB0A|nr:protein artichoke [Chrysoperla carnea]